MNALKELIRINRLHDGDGPVDLTPVFTELNIHEKYKNYPKKLYGYARAEIQDVPASVVLNIRNDCYQQRSTRGHELTHLLFHATQRELYSYDGQYYDFVEEQADYGASYLLVPLKLLKEKARDGWSFEQVAWYLGVIPELVYKRFEIAVELEEI